MMIFLSWRARLEIVKLCARILFVILFLVVPLWLYQQILPDRQVKIFEPSKLICNVDQSTRELIQKEEETIQNDQALIPNNELVTSIFGLPFHFDSQICFEQEVVINEPRLQLDRELRIPFTFKLDEEDYEWDGLRKRKCINTGSGTFVLKEVDFDFGKQNCDSIIRNYGFVYIGDKRQPVKKFDVTQEGMIRIDFKEQVFWGKDETMTLPVYNVIPRVIVSKAPLDWEVTLIVLAIFAGYWSFLLLLLKKGKEIFNLFTKIC